jgi:DNA-binding transcriptional ArsR family regulator
MPFDPLTFGKALADETRQRIMARLCCRELCVGDLVAELGDIVQQFAPEVELLVADTPTSAETT